MESCKDSTVRILTVLILLLGGSQALKASTFKDFALFSQPQKVSHRNTLILGNGQFHNRRVSYGRPFGESEFLRWSQGLSQALSQKFSPIQSPQDNLIAMKSAYENIGDLHDNIYFFEKKGLFEGGANNQFWSYVNSPTYKGGLAFRPFMDQENQDQQKDLEWPDYRDNYVMDRPLELYRAGAFDRMSAAEKYDFLLSSRPTIFKRQVEYSNRVFSRLGEIPHWAGICHGTAPASFSYPAPLNDVVVKGHDNQDLKFSVVDIKRLAAHVWGENYEGYVKVGSRCRSDALGSRKPECLDTNPATFHLALLNYMGLYKKTFVVDNAYDSMVWNRPVMSFSYQYVHPETKLPSRQLKYSMVKLEDLKEDPFAAYRSEEAVFLVGIKMKVKMLYGSENGASSDLDAAYDIVYDYDLEIDKEGKIIGGEWETLYHPDFMWTVKENSLPKTGEDFFIKDSLWDGKESLSPLIKQLGRKAAKRGNLLEYVVRSLIHLSRTQGAKDDYHLQ